MNKQHRYRRRHARAKALREALKSVSHPPEIRQSDPAPDDPRGPQPTPAPFPHLLSWLLEESVQGSSNSPWGPPSGDSLPGSSLSGNLQSGAPAAHQETSSRGTRQPKLEAPEPFPKDPYPPAHRSAALAMASVLVCDGFVTLEEKQGLSAFLEAGGQAPLRESEIRLWLPSQLRKPPSPIPILETLAALAHADGERDETEWRLVKAFGTAWGVSAEDLEALSDDFPSPRRGPALALLSSLFAPLRRLISLGRTTS